MSRLVQNTFGLLCLLLSACTGNNLSSIPDAPVYLQLNLLTTYPTFYGSYGEQIYTEGGKTHYRKQSFPLREADRTGFGGILICSNYEGKYCAFDRACPHEAQRKVCVEVENALYARCPHCGSKFDIYTSEFAFPVTGPAKQGLKKYRVQISPAGILSISQR